MSTEKRGGEIRQFILEHVTEHPGDIVPLTAERFGVSRQAVHRHIQRLVNDQAIESEGTTRNRRYKLHPLATLVQSYPLRMPLEEHRVWMNDIRPFFRQAKDNVRTIWNHGFSEMLNNAVDHSAGVEVQVLVEHNALGTSMIIADNGEGIFKKIQRELGLENEHDAVLELAKGKLTTDPTRHSGEEIFFTSRMFDRFMIMSGTVLFIHEHGETQDWVFDNETSQPGTLIRMDLAHAATQTPQEVFDRFTSGDEYAFTKTVIPVRLAQYGDEQLVSRSQAKRLLARIDRFKVVMFGFEGVDMIGQAFADEVFRVFANAHPDIELHVFRANPAVARMIRHVAEDRADTILGEE